MPDISPRDDPVRYPQMSAIRTFLAARQQGTAPTPAVLSLAVHERWTVKTAADADSAAMTQQQPTETTVEDLVALPVPQVLPPDGRADGAEKTVYTLSGTLTAYRAESDGDFHMVIEGASGNTMIAEIPNPADFTAPSNFSSGITAARQAFDQHFNISEAVAAGASPNFATFTKLSVPVTLTGLGFFDFNHGQLGVASNAIELHPVINISFDAQEGTP